MNALPNTESPTAATQQRKISATRLQNIAATRRQGVAMGMSPWTWMACRNRRYSPEETTGHAIHVAPPGLGSVAVFGDHGLTPMAKTFRPFGTVENQTWLSAAPNTESPTAPTQQRRIAAKRFEKIAATRLQNIAATRRQGVAMGMSPWTWMACRNRRYSPEGTTGHAIHVAPPGLRRVGVFGDHGLTPMAKTFRPFGTVENQTRLRLAGGRGNQLPESAKLEQAIKANLRGLGYGG